MNNIILFTDEQEDIILCLTISFLILLYFGTQIVTAGFNFIGFRDSQIPEILISVVNFTLLVLCIPIVFKRFTTDMVIVLLFFLLAFLISYIFYPQNQPYIEKYVLDVIKVFPAFFIIRVLKDPKILLNILYKTSYILLLFGIIFFIFSSMKEVNRNVGYDMVFGYELCIGILFILNKWIQEKNIYDIMLFFAGFMMILVRGSRGPVLVIVVFLMIKLFFSNLPKKNFYLFFLVLIGALLFILKDNILHYLINTLESYNIYSRNLTFFLSNNSESIEARQMISAIIFNKISANPLGYGVFSDRAILQGIAPYTHNILLEILLDFGWVIGSFVLGYIGLLIYYGFRNKNWIDLVIIFFSYVFVELMFTNSYLVLSYFWILLGILLNAMPEKKLNFKYT